MSAAYPFTFHTCVGCHRRVSQTNECSEVWARCPDNPHGTDGAGPWTRHGHDIPGVTLAGPGRPKVARCGGPRLCPECAEDAAAARPGARGEGAVLATPEPAESGDDDAPDRTTRRLHDAWNRGYEARSGQKPFDSNPWRIR